MATNDYRRSFEELETILQDLDRIPAGWCPICSFSLLEFLWNGTPSLLALQRDNHGLWNACMRQIIAPSRPEDELRVQLQRNIDDCPHTRAYHEMLLVKWEKAHMSDPMAIFMAFVYLCLTKCLYGSDSASDSTESRVLSRAREPNKRFASSDGRWPTHPDQLFPGGPAQTIVSLSLACLDSGDDGPWYILNAIFQLARPRVFHLICSDLIAPRLCMLCIAILFHGTPHDIHTNPHIVLNDSKSLDSYKLPDSPWLASGQGMNIIVVFLRTFWYGPYARPDDLSRFLSYQMPMFCYYYTAAADLYAKTGLEDWKEVMISLNPAAPSVQTAQKQVSDAQVMLQIEQHPRSFAVLLVIWLAWRGLHADRRCCGPACTRTTLDEDSDRPPLPTCAGCKLARYCSTGCQRSDWRGADGCVAHKRICGILCALQRCVGTTSDQHAYAAAMKKADISDFELALVGRWAASKSQTYKNLIRTEIAFPNCYTRRSTARESTDVRA